MNNLCCLYMSQLNLFIIHLNMNYKDTFSKLNFQQKKHKKIKKNIKKNKNKKKNGHKNY